MTGLRDRLRRLLPARALGRPAVVLACLAALFAVVSAQRAALYVRDPDVWWLAAVGRDFILRGVWPRTNFYSFAVPAYPWRTHEWAFSALYAAGLTRIGPGFFPLIGLVCATLTALAVARLGLTRARHPAAGAMMALLSVGATAPALFEPRPAYASLIFPAVVTSLAFGPRFGWRQAAAATVTVWLWTQCHGSFPLGVLLLLASAWSETSSPPARKFRLGAAAAALLATLLNPYGIGLYRLVASYAAGTDPAARVILSSIKEFAPVWRAQPPYRNAFDFAMLSLTALLAMASLAQASTRRRGVVVLGLVAAAVLQVRHLTLAVLLGPVLLTGVVDRWLESDTRTRDARRLSLAGTLAALAPGLLVGAVLWARAWAARSADDWIGTELGGRDAAALIRALPANARVWAPFQTSGLVLWYGATQGVRVLHDPRNDCYPADIAVADWRLGSSETSAKAALSLLDTTGTNTVLAPSWHPRIRQLERSGCWETAAREGRWQVERRVAGPCR